MSEFQREKEKPRRGFAAMNPELQREIASQGGRAAHEKGVAHEWNRAEAMEAGRKGGKISGSKRRNIESNERDLLL